MAFNPSRALIFAFLLLAQTAFAQTYGLSDGRIGQVICLQCQARIEAQPKEVLFGVHIVDGDVYFSMTSADYFNRLFTADTDGITVDIVSKDQLECDQPVISPTRLPRGTFLPPVLLPELKKRIKPRPDGGVDIRLGAIPI